MMGVGVLVGGLVAHWSRVFVAAIGSLTSADYLTRLTDRFGVRRSDRRFWPLSDALHAEWRRRSPGEAAVLDYSRLENN